MLASNVGDLARNARTGEMIALIYECEVAGALAIHRVSARHSDIQWSVWVPTMCNETLLSGQYMFIYRNL